MQNNKQNVELVYNNVGLWKEWTCIGYENYYNAILPFHGKLNPKWVDTIK
jgi:hypothetical protein